MKRRRILAGIILAVVALGAFGSGAAVVIASKGSQGALAQTARRSPGQTLSISCRSPSLGGSLPAEVYLPAGYSRRSSPYPVIYFLHGLPAGPSTYKANAFVADALAQGNLRAIVVAAQGARASNSDREYLDWSSAENWPRAISHDLPSCIDHSYHTVANRLGRALIGVSAGGYGALNIGLRNLHTFAAVESWSGYFVATDPSGEHVLELGSTEADDNAIVPRGGALLEQLAVWPSMIGFYVGRQDGLFLPMNEQFHQALKQSSIAHTFRIYAGGHSGVLWRAQAPAWLGMALRFMSAQARHRSHDGGGGLGPT